MVNMDIAKQLEIIKRGAVDIISEDLLKTKLAKAVPLVIKAGFDPTAPDIHLGHTVLLRKLRQFQDLGHKVIFLIGDFTARIGDPTGRSQLRKQLTTEEVAQNAATYKEQISKVLDIDKIKVVFNSEWFEKMSIVDMLRLTSHATISQVLSRADFKKRLAKGEDISLLEAMYPVLQGYDSVVLRADVELGGTDQIFNLLVGRDLQKDFKQESQVVITMPLLEGIDGVQKMSKSYGNYIGISELPKDVFGKIMSISDELMFKYYELLTDENMDAVKKMHPRDAKIQLAEIIITQYHSKDTAEKEKENFQRVFAQKELPQDIPEYKTDGSQTIVNILIKSGLSKSGNEARRLVEQGGVIFEDSKVIQGDFIISHSGVLKVGARRFLRVIV
ncbi:MAG: tyrosine--tRNA ligase [Candidatus Omnitrophota bacterium]